MRASLTARASAWLALEAARGDAIHYREEAMLALANEIPRAHSRPPTEFRTAKRIPDVRVLARAARVARDASALQTLRHWMRETGYRDSVTEGILGDGASS